MLVLLLAATLKSHLQVKIQRQDAISILSYDRAYLTLPSSIAIIWFVQSVKLRSHSYTGITDHSNAIVRQDGESMGS
jgi:hypothetical protein